MKKTLHCAKFSAAHLNSHVQVACTHTYECITEDHELVRSLRVTMHVNQEASAESRSPYSISAVRCDCRSLSLFTFFNLMHS